MTFTPDSLIEQSLTKIEYIQNHAKAVVAACDYINQGFSSPVRGGELYTRLMERELEAWRELFMWALVVDEKSLQRIRAAAYARFLSDQMSVSSYFLGENLQPRGWLVAEEQQFRRMARELFLREAASDKNDTPNDSTVQSDLSSSAKLTKQRASTTKRKKP